MVHSIYKKKLDVSNSHVDKDALMKELSIVNALQDIEGLHIDSLTTFNNYLLDNNLGIFLLYRQIDIVSKPKFTDQLTLTTYPYKTSIIGGYRHIYVHDEEGELLVKTNSFGAFVNLDTYLPERIPKEIIRTILDGKESLLMDVLSRKVEHDNTNFFNPIEEIKIKRSHIDRYNHVNNAYYIEFALDSFKEEITYNRIRAEYKDSFKYGDTVYVSLNIDEKDKKTIILSKDSTTINAIIEFTNVNLA